MIDWQNIALALIGALSSWHVYELRRLRSSLHEVRNNFQAIVSEVSYLKGYLAKQKESQ